MNRRYCCIARTAVGLLILAGCQSPAPSLAEADAPAAVPTAEPDEAGVYHYVDASAVLLVVDVTSTHTVTFYESVPGNITIVERRTRGERSLLPRELPPTVSELFALLWPGEGIPEILLDADARAATLADEPRGEAPLVEVLPSMGGGAPSPVHEDPKAPAPPSEPGVGRLEQAHSTSGAAHFVADHGGCDWAKTSSGCRVQWSGGFFGFASTGSSATFKVDHYSGNGITVRLMLGTSIEDHPQAAGTFADYALFATRGKETKRIDLLNASGDSFHVGCKWN
jgi:hypothetical protein